MKATRFFLSAISVAAAICFLGAAEARPRPAQGSPQKPAEKAPESIQEKKQEKPAAKVPPKLPAEIELLETHIRFESDGSSRKEVHARVKINDELGVRQFARLNFDFNRSFEQIEIPLVRITHPSGGIIDVLPSAITDTPNPAVVNAPAYQDVRVKSVRILGLEPGDSLEYRVITTVSHHPLAPDFWLDHSFDRSGVVSEEHFELDLPTSRKVQLHASPAISQREIIGPESRTDDRVIYRWQFLRQSTGTGTIEVEPLPDITVTTFASWKALSSRLEELLTPLPEERERVWNKAAELAGSISSNKLKIVALYDFVSKKVSTVDLPLGATGFHQRAPAEILSSAYATQEDKFTLLAGLASAFNESTGAAIVGASADVTHSLPNPSAFTHLLVTTPMDPTITPGTGCGDCFQVVWLDPSVEVAPFGMIAANFRGKSALRLGFFGSEMPASVPALVPTDLPFPATQHVKIDANLSPEGALTARAKYTMRGDNELLLRMAFHQSTKEKWDGVAQLLALSDGFRGKVSKATCVRSVRDARSLHCLVRDNAGQICGLVEKIRERPGDPSPTGTSRPALKTCSWRPRSSHRPGHAPRCRSQRHSSSSAGNNSPYPDGHFSSTRLRHLHFAIFREGCHTLRLAPSQFYFEANPRRSCRRLQRLPTRCSKRRITSLHAGAER